MEIIVLTISLFIVPALMIGVGLLWGKYPPENINWIYGYRTRRSMREQRNWDYAHRYYTKVSLYLGLALTALTIIGIIVLYGETLIYIGHIFLIIQMIVLIASIVITEIELARKFVSNKKKTSNS